MTFGSGGASGGFAASHRPSQTVAHTGRCEMSDLHPLVGIGPVSDTESGIGAEGIKNDIHFQLTHILTVREVASHLRVCRANVYRLIASGRLPAIRVNGSFLRVRAETLSSIIVEGASGHTKR